MARTPLSYNHCITAVMDASGRQDLSDEDLIRIFSRVQQVADRLRRERGITDPIALARATGQEVGGELRAAALIEQRNAALNVLRLQELNSGVIPGREADSVRAVLTGFSGRRGRPGDFEGAARSIDAERHAIRDQMSGGILHDLRQDNVLGVVLGRDKAFDRDVAVEMWALSDPTSARQTNNPHAIRVARTLNKYQEALRGWLNEAGAWIGKVDQYITRQSHDMMKVRGDGSAGAFDVWRRVIEPKLAERTFDGVDDRGAFLRHVWDNIASGVHESSSRAVDIAGFKGPANIAKRMSQERVLHFRDADAWFDYNEQFGKGAVIDSVMHAIEKGTRDLALMRRLGPNPEAMHQNWTDALTRAARDRGAFGMVDTLRDVTNDRILDVLTGKADIPASVTKAKIFGTIRVMESLARLGGVVLSSIPDLTVNAAMLRHNGVGIFEAYSRQMLALLPKGAEREVAEQLGVGLDHMLGHVMHRFSADEGFSGQASNAARLFYRLSGLTYWTDSLKHAAGLMLSRNLATRSGTAFAELPERMQVSLRRYGIDAGEWSTLAAHVTRAGDGLDYILPAHMPEGELTRKLSAYIIDQVREGMTEPSAGNRTTATLGTQRGTTAGEVVRLLAQFKQYTITYLDRSVGREMFRTGADVGGIAHLIVATTALGYLSMTLKELVKGRSPRQPEDPAGYAKTVSAAMAQGGGLGIYGDFLFGDANRLGGGFIGTLAGPTAGTLDDVRRVLMDLRNGEGHPAADTIGAIKNNTPFVNLFWSRAVLDYLVLYRIQEWANPGYLRRLEHRVKKENNQEFWLRPSAVAN